MKGGRALNLSLIDQALVSACNFVTAIILARALGSHDFGIFTLGYLVLLLVVAFQLSLVTLPMMSIGPKQPERQTPYYYFGVAVHQAGFAIASFILVLAGVALAGWLLPDSPWSQLRVALPVAVSGFVLQDFTRRLLFVRSRPLLAIASDALSYLTQIAVLGLLFSHIDLTLAFWVIGGTSLIGSLLALPVLRPLRWDKTQFRSVTSRHWRFARWHLPSTTLSWGSGNIMLIAAAGLLSPAAVGIFRAAQNIMGVTNVVYLGLPNASVPKLGLLVERGDSAEVSAYIRRLTIWTTGAVLVFAGILWVGPGFWLGLIYGEAYSGYGAELVVLSTAYVLMFLALPMSLALLGWENTRALFKADLAAFLAGLAVIYPLLNYFGLMGIVSGFVVIKTVCLALVARGYFREMKAHRERPVRA